MKKTLLLCLLALSITAQAQYILSSNDVEFSNGKITNYLNTTEKDIVIPNNFKGIAVTEIGYNAFANNQLTSVTIPNSVTKLHGWSFSFNELTSVIIPNSVTRIGEGVFVFNLLTEYSLPSSHQGEIHEWVYAEPDPVEFYLSGDVITGLWDDFTLIPKDSPTGILSANKNIFSFYPNPSTDFIHSDLEVSTLTFSNSQGVVVKQFQSNATKYNVSNLAYCVICSE